MMRYCIRITGRVQGVSYRKYAAERAVELGVNGFVMNMPDGSVYCEAEGVEEDLQNFIDWCGMGSPFSEVRGMEVSSREKAGFKVFEIRKNG